MSEETCTFPLCNRKVEKNGYCFLHKIYSDMPAEKKQPKPIPKKSAKKKVVDRELKKIVTDLKLINPLCELRSPVCTFIAEGSDHTQKRSPGNVLDKDNIKLSCNACNTYKESHPQWAKDNGHFKSKFTPNVIRASMDEDLKAIVIEKG